MLKRKTSTLVLGAAFAATAIALPAHAKSTSEMISMCVAEIESQNLATAENYAVKMKRISGASVKKLTIDYKANGSDEDKSFTCKVRRSKVMEITPI